MKRLIPVLAGVLALAACGSDTNGRPGSAAADDPALPVAAATTTLPDDAVTTTESRTPETAVAEEAGTTAPADTTTAENAGTSPADTTTTENADTSPADTTAPADTTPVGPLPVPVVELTEVAQVPEAVEVAARPGDDRLIAVTQSGFVEAHGGDGTATLLDISDLTERRAEQGLLGIAFHPTEPFAYVHFTDLDDDTVVAEYSVDPTSGVLDRGTERVVFTAGQPYDNHNGGKLAFGPDGLLYLGLGDGGSANDPERVSLDLTSPLGKIHRFDPRPDGDGGPLTVPADNPFVDTEGAVPTIWSYGLRNPWRFSFDPLTGDLWVADVGQSSQEEVTRVPATAGLGAGRAVNFGWSAWEGTGRFNEDQPADGAVGPTLTYSHAGGNCSVSGGAVARGAVNGDLAGWYVFGDYCSGVIWGYDTTTVGGEAVVVELAGLPALAGVSEGPDGALYAYSQNGPVVRLTAA